MMDWGGIGMVGWLDWDKPEFLMIWAEGRVGGTWVFGRSGRRRAISERIAGHLEKFVVWLPLQLEQVGFCSFVFWQSFAK
jgi:hypothetical protein